MLRIYVIGFIIIVSIIAQICFAFENNDFQYWNSETISGKLTDTWTADIEQGFRFGNDASDFYHQYSDLGFTCPGLTDWFKFGINYRLVFEESNDEWNYENRPHLNAILQYNIHGFKLSNRSRLEYRDKESGDDGWRYRNKFSIKIPIKITRFEIQPYAAEEFFIDFNIKQINRNRLYSGFAFKITKKLSGEIFYLRQSTESSDRWTDYNILGTKLRLSF